MMKAVLNSNVRAFDLVDDKILFDRLKDLRQQVGNTPMVAINDFHKNPKVKILAKIEWLQIGGSVKARAAFEIIKDALANGELSRNRVLVDASSGNTAIAYATILARLGIRTKLFVPENASKERLLILKSLGAELTLTPAEGGTDLAQQMASDFAAKNPEIYYYANQYANSSNWRAHFYHTAEEIIAQTQGELSHFVAGIGTSGTVVGASKKLKLWDAEIQTIALQPDVALHLMEGWKHLESAVVPPIYSAQNIDEFRNVSSEAVFRFMQKAAQKGWLLSPSSAANWLGALQVAEGLERGVVVTVFPDNSDKYGELFSQIIQN